MSDPRHIIAGSERSAPPGQRVGAVNPQEQIEVSVYLHDQAPQGGTSREECQTARCQRLGPTVSELTQFATEHGLRVTCEDPARRLVKLAGPADKLAAAFGTKLEQFEHNGRTFRGRTGPLTVPAPLAGKVQAVLGLDDRPAATPKIAFPRNAAVTSFYPNQIAALYAFPQTSAKSQCIGIIELGGGYNEADTGTAFRDMNLTPPAVVAVPVSGGKNTPGEDQGADGEVALDIQVAGGAAPDAKIAVYFAPNTDQGFVDAITAAVHDKTNKPSVISISWGGPENGWTAQSVASMNAAFADAASLGVSVFAASGDSLASDGVGDGQPHVDFPAASPYVVGCGGTRVSAAVGKINSEVVWNADGGGTGGGVSALFALPDYQKNAKVPVADSKPGRGVPDVSADADPNSGYRIVVDGTTSTIGGTSAAAPLWAGLFALLNEARGTPIGQPHAILYGNASDFRDITQGDNRQGSVGYAAGPGWDACTGLGSPNGAALLKAFSAKPTS